ncbi:biopolymer transporter ExbD [uncultured Tateyamaria sp.]|uniref:ExbD/TolR family protein n=1 Tax=uncultured Tateyamaria sp. TaxID=455651 RepID=UPI0026278E17|nr:biopolymer transporter ExbD [uncultured Tateyamaria sp.]
MASRRAPLPERPRRYRFVLTPLADAMFQLLIFFMLSSSLAPYSLITLKTAAEPVSEEDATAAGPGNDPNQPAPPTQAADVTLWTVGNGTVRSAGLDYDIDQLSALAEALSEGAPGSVVLIVTSEARVQDVASALEALEGANVGAVQISRGGA